jgi:dTDP-4-amino-4,6-dideoxygalactose transaminase
MMDLQAAIGLHQLRRIESNLRRREVIWEHYDRGLAALPLVRPAAPSPHTRHARHLYTVLVDPARCGMDRRALATALAARGIATSVHFKALHLHSYYAGHFGLRRGQFPAAEHVSDTTLSLPLSAATTPADARAVINAIRDALAMSRAA